MAKPRDKKTKQRHMSLTDEVLRQIDELAAAFSMSRSQVVRHAVARWYRVEFPQPPTKD